MKNNELIIQTNCIFVSTQTPQQATGWLPMLPVCLRHY